jgi:hypothetical protein
VAAQDEPTRERIAASLAAGKRPSLDLLHPGASEVFKALGEAWPGPDHPTRR